MCLIFVAHRLHPDYPLIFAANRDEFYNRPTAAAGFWPQAPQVLGGRDLAGGGSWFGVSRSGRLAAVTNYRNLAEVSGAGQDKRSRGLLVSDFLLGDEAPQPFLAALQGRRDAYRGFNLLLGEPGGLHYFSNRGGAPLALAPGLYGRSNHLLDTPWPKLAQGKAAFARLLGAGRPDPEAFFALLADTAQADDAQLPETGLSREWERTLSARFIVSPEYGTRASTLLLVDSGGRALFCERSFAPGGAAAGEVRQEFSLGGL